MPWYIKLKSKEHTVSVIYMERGRYFSTETFLRLNENLVSIYELRKGLIFPNDEGKLPTKKVR